MTMFDAALVSGRQPATIVQLFMSKCSHTFGVAPCTAIGTGNAKCFNTLATCKDRPNYGETKTFIYNFATTRVDGFQQAGESPVYPVITSVDTAPTVLDPGKGLGQRAVCKVKFTDFPDSGAFTDPYVFERTGALADARSLGSFWGKFTSRNRFFENRKIVVYTGYLVNGVYNAANFITRTYFITEMDTNDGAGVTITAKDPLKFADVQKSVWPRLSVNTLLADITVSQTTLQTTQLSEFNPAQPYIVIGQEVMKITGITGTGPYTLTVIRAQATGSGSTVGGQYRADTNTTMVDPGTGDWRWSNATQASATQLAISVTDSAGASKAAIFALMVAGDRLHIEDNTNASIFSRFTMVSKVNNGTWYLFTVTPFVSSGGNIANNKQCIVAFSQISGGTQGAMPSYYIAQTNIPVEHKAGSLINRSYEVGGVPISSVIYGLLIQAGIDPIYIESADVWAALFISSGMGDYVLTTLIATPVGIKKLLDELAALNVLIFWDDRAQKVRCLPLVFSSVNTVPLDDTNNLLENTTVMASNSKGRASQVWLFYDASNPTYRVTEPDTFVATEVQANLSLELPEAYGNANVSFMFVRWLENNATAAAAVAARRLQRYAYTIQSIGFELDPKDAQIWTGDQIRISTFLLQDDFGAPSIQSYLITQADEVLTSDGIRYKYQAQQIVQYAGGTGGWSFPVGSVIPPSNPAAGETVAASYDLASAGQRQGYVFWGYASGNFPINNNPSYSWV